MNDMPDSTVKWYKLWINAFPESGHQNDWERFYMFVSSLLQAGKKERTRFWLKKNLKEDCSKISDAMIEEYCDAFDHINGFKKAWKGQLAKLVAQDIHNQNRLKFTKSPVRQNHQ